MEPEKGFVNDLAMEHREAAGTSKLLGVAALVLPEAA